MRNHLLTKSDVNARKFYICISTGRHAFILDRVEFFFLLFSTSYTRYFIETLGAFSFNLGVLKLCKQKYV